MIYINMYSHVGFFLGGWLIGFLLTTDKFDPEPYYASMTWWGSYIGLTLGFVEVLYFIVRSFFIKNIFNTFCSNSMLFLWK